MTQQNAVDDAQLDSTTGQDDGFLRLNISGNYQYPGVLANATRCTTKP